MKSTASILPSLLVVAGLTGGCATTVTQRLTLDPQSPEAVVGGDVAGGLTDSVELVWSPLRPVNSIWGIRDGGRLGIVMRDSTWLEGTFLGIVPEGKELRTHRLRMKEGLVPDSMSSKGAEIVLREDEHIVATKMTDVIFVYRPPSGDGVPVSVTLKDLGRVDALFTGIAPPGKKLESSNKHALYWSKESWENRPTVIAQSYSLVMIRDGKHLLVPLNMVESVTWKARSSGVIGTLALYAGVVGASLAYATICALVRATDCDLGNEIWW